MKSCCVLIVAIALLVTSTTAFAQGELRILARDLGDPTSESRFYDPVPGQPFEIVVVLDDSDGVFAHEWEAYSPELDQLFDTFQAFEAGSPFYLGLRLTTVDDYPVNRFEVIAGVGSSCPAGRQYLAVLPMVLQVPVEDLVVRLGRATHGAEVAASQVLCDGVTTLPFRIPQLAGTMTSGVEFPVGSVVLGPNESLDTWGDAYIRMYAGNRFGCCDRSVFVRPGETISLDIYGGTPNGIYAHEWEITSAPLQELIDLGQAEIVATQILGTRVEQVDGVPVNPLEVIAEVGDACRSDDTLALFDVVLHTQVEDLVLAVGPASHGQGSSALLIECGTLTPIDPEFPQPAGETYAGVPYPAGAVVINPSEDMRPGSLEIYGRDPLSTQSKSRFYEVPVNEPFEIVVEANTPSGFKEHEWELLSAQLESLMDLGVIELTDARIRGRRATEIDGTPVNTFEVRSLILFTDCSELGTVEVAVFSMVAREPFDDFVLALGPATHGDPAGPIQVLCSRIRQVPFELPQPAGSLDGLDYPAGSMVLGYEPPPDSGSGAAEILARDVGEPSTESRFYTARPGDPFEIVVVLDENEGVFAHEWELISAELDQLFDSSQASEAGPRTVLGQPVGEVAGEPVNRFEVVSSLGGACPAGRQYLAVFPIVLQVATEDLVVRLGAASHGSSSVPSQTLCDGTTTRPFQIPQPAGQTHAGANYPEGSLVIDPSENMQPGSLTIFARKPGMPGSDSRFFEVGRYEPFEIVVEATSPAGFLSHEWEILSAGLDSLLEAGVIEQTAAPLVLGSEASEVDGTPVNPFEVISQLDDCAGAGDKTLAVFPMLAREPFEDIILVFDAASHGDPDGPVQGLCSGIRQVGFELAQPAGSLDGLEYPAGSMVLRYAPPPPPESGALQILARDLGDPSTESRFYPVTPGQPFEIVVVLDGRDGVFAHEWEAVSDELGQLFESFQAFLSGTPTYLGLPLTMVGGEPVNRFEVIAGVGTSCPAGRQYLAVFPMMIQPPVEDLVVRLASATHGREAVPSQTLCDGVTTLPMNIPQPAGATYNGVSYPVGSLVLSPSENMQPGSLEIFGRAPGSAATEFRFYAASENTPFEIVVRATSPAGFLRHEWELFSAQLQALLGSGVAELTEPPWILGTAETEVDGTPVNDFEVISRLESCATGSQVVARFPLVLHEPFEEFVLALGPANHGDPAGPIQGLCSGIREVGFRLPQPAGTLGSVDYPAGAMVLRHRPPPPAQGTGTLEVLARDLGDPSTESRFYRPVPGQPFEIVVVADQTGGLFSHQWELASGPLESMLGIGMLEQTGPATILGTEIGGDRNRWEVVAEVGSSCPTGRQVLAVIPMVSNAYFQEVAIRLGVAGHEVGEQPIYVSCDGSTRLAFRIPQPSGTTDQALPYPGGSVVLGGLEEPAETGPGELSIYAREVGEPTTEARVYDTVPGVPFEIVVVVENAESLSQHAWELYSPELALAFVDFQAFAAGSESVLGTRWSSIGGQEPARWEVVADVDGCPTGRLYLGKFPMVVNLPFSDQVVSLGPPRHGDQVWPSYQDCETATRRMFDLPQPALNLGYGTIVPRGSLILSPSIVTPTEKPSMSSFRARFRSKSQPKPDQEPQEEPKSP